MKQLTALPRLTSLEQIHRDLQKIPKLDAEEEANLARKWQKEHDLIAVQQLIMCNLHTVAAIAREYRNFGLPEEDLFQEGTIGLMRAVKGFDPDRGFRLKTYASWWIRAAIHDFILHSWSIVKMGTSKLQRRIFAGLRKAEHAIAALEGRNVDEVGRKYGISGKRYQALASSFLQSDISLDDDSIGRQKVMALPSPARTPEQHVIDQDWEEFTRQRLESALAILNDRDRHIIELRHISENPSTLKELANELGISIERVRQLESRAIQKIKTYLSEQKS